MVFFVSTIILAMQVDALEYVSVEWSIDLDFDMWIALELIFIFSSIDVSFSL